MPGSIGKTGKLTSSRKRPIAAISSSQGEAPADIQSGSEPIFTIEEILRRKTDNDGSRKYLVKWLGYHKKKSTWEPEDHLPKYWLAQFNRAEDLKDKYQKMRGKVAKIQACVKEVDPNFPDPEEVDEQQFEKAVEGLKAHLVKAQPSSTATVEQQEEDGELPSTSTSGSGVTAPPSLPEEGGEGESGQGGQPSSTATVEQQEEDGELPSTSTSGSGVAAPSSLPGEGGEGESGQGGEPASASATGSHEDSAGQAGDGPEAASASENDSQGAKGGCVVC